MKNITKIFIAVIFIAATYTTQAQIKGKESPEYNKDTVFVYQSPRPLVNKDQITQDTKQAWGLDLLLSNNGFGFGFFYQKMLDEDLFAFSSLYLSGARNTDELEVYDYIQNKYYIPNKINRLFMFPFTLGIQRFFLRELLHENLKPFLNIGIGSSFIISTPYEKEFFTSFGYADSYTRFTSFIGGGANVGSGNTTMVSVNMRYYFIPFGGKGLESIKGNPINDFGGFFLSLSLGAKF